jgi:hypothetical protein
MADEDVREAGGLPFTNRRVDEVVDSFLKTRVMPLFHAVAEEQIKRER